MSDLFDRYYSILSGRVAEADCGTVVSPYAPEIDCIASEVPLELLPSAADRATESLPSQSEIQAAGK